MEINLLPVTVTVQDAAKLLGVSRPTVYQLMKTKGFPAFRVGNRTLIDYELLKEWSKKQVELTERVPV